MRSPLLAAPRRALARVAGAVAVAVVLSACSFITGVPNVSRVELSVTPTVIAPGQQVQASGVPIGKGGSIVTHSRRQISYQSSDDSVATVTPGGLITGKNPGRVTIKASSDGKSASVEMTVRPIPVRQVIITPRTPIVRLAPSITVLIGAAVIDTNNQVLGASRPANWASLDPGVATIAATGAITPKTLGTARIVASVDTGIAPAVGRVADTVSVRVTPTPVSSVRIAPANPTLYTGQTLQFTANVVDSLQQVVTDRRVIWKTTDRGTNLAVDSLTGFATVVSPSTITTLTATVETVQGFPNTDFRSDATSVTVLAPAASARVQSAGVTITTLALRAGTSQQLSFQALDAVSNLLGGRQFRVTSDTPTVAAATAGGLVTAGAATGSATITVQTLDASGNAQGTPATVAVTVTP